MNNTKPMGRPKTPDNARSKMMGISLPADMEAALRAFAKMQERGISQTVRMLLKVAPNPDWQRLLALTAAELQNEVIAARAKAQVRADEEERKALASPHWNPAKAERERRNLARSKAPAREHEDDDDVEI